MARLVERGLDLVRRAHLDELAGLQVERLGRRGLGPGPVQRQRLEQAEPVRDLHHERARHEPDEAQRAEVAVA